jgi:hypothetical protein
VFGVAVKRLAIYNLGQVRMATEMNLKMCSYNVYCCNNYLSCNNSYAMCIRSVAKSVMDKCYVQFNNVTNISTNSLSCRKTDT